AMLTVRRAAERKLESPEWFSLIPYFVGCLREDDELRRTATAATKGRLEDMIAHLEALAMARAGRLQEARRMATVPVEIARRSGRSERAALFAAGICRVRSVVRQRRRRRREIDRRARARTGP